MTTTNISVRLARVSRLAAALVLLGCVATTPALAQTPSLADLAKREQERRKTLKAPTKVYTKDDLPPAAAAPVAPVVPAAAPATPAAETAAPTEPATDDPKAKGEDWWRQRMAQVREELRRNELFAEALQSRMNAMAVDVANRDDPAQRQKLSEERQKAVQEFGRVQGDIAKARQQIIDIEEEARQAGVPPGWVR